jgi:hypothetical protein
MDALSVQCCFCGNSIEARDRDPLSLVIPVEPEGWQQLWSHEKCLRDRLHESVPVAFDDDED